MFNLLGDLSIKQKDRYKDGWMDGVTSINVLVGVPVSPPPLSISLSPFPVNLLGRHP